MNGMLKSNSRATLLSAGTPMAADSIVPLSQDTAGPDRSYRHYIINGMPVTVTLIGRDLQRLEQMFDDLVEEWGLDTEQKAITEGSMTTALNITSRSL
jgi:hypothetical protein